MNKSLHGNVVHRLSPFKQSESTHCSVRPPKPCAASASRPDKNKVSGVKASLEVQKMI